MLLMGRWLVLVGFLLAILEMCSVAVRPPHGTSVAYDMLKFGPYMCSYAMFASVMYVQMGLAGRDAAKRYVPWLILTSAWLLMLLYLVAASDVSDAGRMRDWRTYVGLFAIAIPFVAAPLAFDR